jgi:hypothetical protein
MILHVFPPDAKKLHLSLLKDEFFSIRYPDLFLTFIHSLYNLPSFVNYEPLTGFAARVLADDRRGRPGNWQARR